MEGSGILQSIKWICSASADQAGLILHPNDEQAELTVANSGTPSCLGPEGPVIFMRGPMED